MERRRSQVSPLLVSLVIFMTCFVTSRADAKRMAPREVSPVIWNGVRYTAPRYGCGFAHPGCIEASDAETGRTLWQVEVYQIQYRSDLGKDVQDVFIVSLKVEANVLVVTNEHGETYEVNLETKGCSEDQNSPRARQGAGVRLGLDDLSEHRNRGQAETGA